MTGKHKYMAAIIDLSGVLYIDEHAVPGSVEAYQHLLDSGLPHCFLTNTTRQTRDSLCRNLQHMGYDIAPERVMTAASAAHAYVQQHRLRPYLLIHPDLQDEFDDLDCQNPNAVVVGDAGQNFTYERMNAAFRVLTNNGDAPLIAMGANRYFKEDDGLSLDMGPFVRALEYASGRRAVFTGKPAASFFRAALHAVDKSAAETVIIGDDLENDIGGAQATGIDGILVRTGKFRPEDETATMAPLAIVDNFSAAIDSIL